MREFVKVSGYGLLVIGVLLISTLTMHAQTLAQQPMNSFRSTSVMQGSGSAYSANPLLNTDGTASYQGASYSPKRPGQIRKDGNPFEGGGILPSNPVEPGTPLGDGLIPLLLMALVFMSVKALLKKQRSNSLK